MFVSYCIWMIPQLINQLMGRNRYMGWGRKFLKMFFYFYLFKSHKYLELYCLKLYPKMKTPLSSCLASL